MLSFIPLFILSIETLLIGGMPGVALGELIDTNAGLLFPYPGFALAFGTFLKMFTVSTDYTF